MTYRNPYNKSASRFRQPTGMYFATVSNVDGTDVYVKVPRLSNDFEHGPIPYAGALPTIGDEIYVGFLEGSMDDVVAVFPGSDDGGSTGPIEVTNFVAAIDCRTELRTVADYLCDGTSDLEQIEDAVVEVAALGGGNVVLSEGNFSDIDGPGMSWATTGADITIKGAGRYATSLILPNANPGGNGIFEPPTGTRLTLKNLSIYADDTISERGAADYIVYNPLGYTAYENVYIDSFTLEAPGCC